MIYLLWGEDTFSRDEALAEIKAGLGPGLSGSAELAEASAEGPEELLWANTTRFKGRETTVEELLGICHTLPFLTPWRLVIVEGLVASFDTAPGGRDDPSAPEASRPSASGGRAEALTATLTEGLTTIPPTTVLVFLEEELKPTNPLLQRLSASGGLAQARRFSSLKGDGLRSWIQRRVQTQGGRIAPAAARLLADTVGDDLRLLAQEIDKLLLYAEGQPITENTVELMVPQTRQESIFSLVDAIAQGQGEPALQRLRRLEDEGAAAPYLLFMIARQFRILLRIKALAQEGQPPAAIRQRLGLRDYAFNKSWAQARRYSWDKLVAAHRRLLQADLAIKTGQEAGALELLIADLGSLEARGKK